MSQCHRRTASQSARARTGLFFSAAVFIVLAAVGAFLLVHSDSSAATVVLVPTSDRSNDTIGWQRDDSDVDCGSSGTVCSSLIDEDADSPLSNSNERIETESAVPSDDEVTFELTDLPADAELISAVRVRYRAREGNSPALPDAKIIVEVVNGASVLGSPSEHDLSIIFQEFSYDVTGLQLTKAEGDALYLRITADGGQQVEVSVVNVEVVYSTQPNPTLARSCGLDIVLVIDHSASINSSEMTTLKGAMTGFVNAFLPGTPTEIAVVGFDSTAQVLQGFTNNAATANAAINGIPVGGGWTNWDDALFDARNLFPNRTNPDLIIFGSDGNPTARYGHGGNPFETNVDTFLTMQEAVPEADAAKAAGVRIITLGIGSQASSGNLAGISSPDAVVVSDFGDLATDLAALADDLCGGTITVHKIIDQDGNIGTTGDQTDGQSWNFSADASPDSSNPSSGNTDANGQINFDIDLGADDSASVDITETQQAGHAFISASCSDGQSTIGTPGTLEVTNIPLTPTDIVTCTFYNRPAETFVVTKDWQPNNPGGQVNVTLTCLSGTVSPAGAQQITGDNSVQFSVSGFVGDPTCTATESPNPPPGYSSTGTCNAALSTGSCTITNTLNEGDFRVRKDFQPDSGASVSVTVSCSSGTVTTGAQSVTEASPKSWHVTGYTGNPTCTATENPVPTGYTSSGTCSALLSAGECTIVNVLGSANFTVFKDWVPDNAGGQVDVTLSCTSGAVTPPNPKQITGDSSVQFEVTGYTGNPSCTATESPNPPAGYSSTGTCSAPLLGAARIAFSVGGQCTIVNTLNEATLTVNKNFVPDSGASVNVTVDCGGNGTITPPSATATEAAPAVFTITGFTPPLTCTAVESPVPQGYVDSDNCQGLSISVGQQASCTITNTLRSAQVVVQKNFVPDSGASVNISVTCTSGSVANDDTTASEADPANFTVTGFNVGATCTASEGIPAGYTANQADCVSRGITHGQTTTCTITNTLREGDFRVRKDFSDDSTDAVTVTVTCTGGGTVTTGAQQVTETSPQSWHVEGFDGDPTCTATENPIPNGYDSSGTCSALLSVGECTITNTAREGDFTVLKDFQPDSADSVTVSLSCASGDVSPPSAQASESVPAAFNVSGYVGDPTCTATESSVPTGYTSTGTCNAALIAVGQCTIVNELNEASLVVQKDFTDDNVSEVMVSVTCNSGTVSPAGPQAVSEGNPATFVISGFTPPLTCTATENPVPDDYEVDVSDCLNVPIAIGGEEVCTITNALVTPTPSPTPSATPSGTPTGTAPVTATPSPTPTPTPTPTGTPTATPTATAPVTASPSPTPTPTPSPTALPATSVPATPTPSPTALPATSVPATPSPSPTALPVQLPPTGGAGDATSPLLLWLVALGIACLVAGSTFGTLALRRR